LVPLLVFFIIHILFVAIHSFCAIFCIIPHSTSNIFLYLINSSNFSSFGSLKCSSDGLTINVHLYIYIYIFSSLDFSLSP
jgi:hypothetical protein